ncbi:MAG: UbiH/UbiF/VisC/COQ6 family ubiquinone biosynthesis hydroxylase [Ferrovibrio sp.]|uniref:UbiH/UbiF/VisC/COQ6 family ubiquinone biosynthesis hydroxylase n=1 Tax=Ferrovibrio sp. TaxID=1917215 RepID=UPI00262E545A|nr:UbiH/UbiF/VisC/COQ6 family ubiquinone biosynthesis hydroxylase [Ferrovibrio sp.]MCW0235436.1 UbiH/UbiF/VisC/COQ6 family ubiquinone biosynthesis hydroxylase [Ferrovibrio sp.]
MTSAAQPAPADQFDVAVIGGGLNGLTQAIALARHGISVAVIDREDPARATAAGFDGRVSAIALASQRMLDAIGLWRHVSAAQPMWDIRVSDGDSLLFVHYDHTDIGSDPFGYLVENRVTRLAQQAALADCPNLELIAPMTARHIDYGAAGSGAPAVLDLDNGRRIGARLVIGADGRQSAVRREAGIRTIDWSYNQTGIVCTVQHELPHEGVAQERFLPAGPFAILPMTDDEAGRHRSSLVWTEPTERAAAIMALDDAGFVAEMRQRFGTGYGDCAVVGPRWSYPLSFMLATRYAGHRMALIGDAAHGIHPIAGQGLNLGLRDIAALTEAVVEARRLGLDIGRSDVLDRYERWRRVDNVVLGAVTDGLTRLFSNDIAPLRIARDLGLGVVNRIGPLKKLFMRHAMGDIGRLPRLLKGESLV